LELGRYPASMGTQHDRDTEVGQISDHTEWPLMGQSLRFDHAPVTSGLPQQADVHGVSRYVSNVPPGDIRHGRFRMVYLGLRINWLAAAVME
jgi:hypothetical protein